jgi:hypothetical protein
VNTEILKRALKIADMVIGQNIKEVEARREALTRPPSLISADISAHVVWSAEVHFNLARCHSLATIGEKAGRSERI